MIFANIKGITIPEGAVKQIADSTGRILWKGGAVDVSTMVIGYTGAFTDQKDVVMSGKTYRLLTLTGSGTLTLEGTVTADVWLCSGGNGGYSYNTLDSDYAGSGGGGGYFTQSDSIVLGKNTVCTIGAGGENDDNGYTSSFGTIYSPSQSHDLLNGASGGGAGGTSVVIGAGEGMSTVPFLETTLFDKHSAGGGGGAYTNNRTSKKYAAGAGGSNGASGNGRGVQGTSGAGSGGTKGGGNGGSPSADGVDASNATFYGSGGGGGGYYRTAAGGGYEGFGGYGYQGVIYVRIPYEQ